MLYARGTVDRSRENRDLFGITGTLSNKPSELER